MLSLPFDKPGRFWRGNLHTHSNASDGRISVEAVCNRYKEEGYDFLAVTDHFMERYNFPLTDTRSFRSDNFTTILGAELHAGQTEQGDIWHILAVGLPLDFAPPTPVESGPELAARALEVGAYVAAAHPNWYTLSEADILSLGSIHAIEVFNGVAVDHNDRGDSWHITDVLLGRGKRYTVCATDDFHANPMNADFSRGWVWVKSESLEPESLVAALKAGHYYSSTGPQLHHVEVHQGEKLYIRSSPVSRIWVTGRSSLTRRIDGHGLTEVELSLADFNSPYCRITVRDIYGRQAWSNPIWFDV
jgi:hypothetical protein